MDYVEDPFYIFENLHTLSADETENKVLDTVSWVITDKNGQVEENSGFNAFNGGAKLAKKIGWHVFRKSKMDFRAHFGRTGICDLFLGRNFIEKVVH